MSSALPSTFPVGVGCYPATIPADALAALPPSGNACVLVMGEPGKEQHDLAAALTARGFDVARRRFVPDPQIDFALSADANADKWVTWILGGLSPDQFRATYKRAVGPNECYSNGRPEHFPFLVAIEVSICEQLHALGVAYAWGSIAVGNVDPSVFATVCAPILAIADATCYHVYTAPNLTTLDPSANTWYARRPYAWWLACKAGGIRFPPLLAGESGTFTPWRDLGLNEERYAALLGSISDLLAGWRAEGMPVLGQCFFALGAEGAEATWNLSQSGIDALSRWNRQPNLQGGLPVATIPLPAEGTSPNHDGLRATYQGLILHSTRGGAADLQSEYDATVAWFHNPAPEGNPALAVSADAICGPVGQLHRPCPPNTITWHARYYNATHRGLEMVQPHRGDPIADDVFDLAARTVAAYWVADKAAGHAWPLVWDRVNGLAEHWEIPPGIADGKSDVEAPFDRNRFLALATFYAQGASMLTDAQKATVLAHFDIIWGFSDAAVIAKNPQESQVAIRERIVAVKQALGLS